MSYPDGSAPSEGARAPCARPSSDAPELDLNGPDGSGLRIEGGPEFALTARRWDARALDAARHPHELTEGDRIHLRLDLAHYGLGSASCGPGVLAEHQLPAGTHRLRPAFVPLGQPDRPGSSN